MAIVTMLWLGPDLPAMAASPEIQRPPGQAVPIASVDVVLPAHNPIVRPGVLLDRQLPGGNPGAASGVWSAVWEDAATGVGTGHLRVHGHNPGNLTIARWHKRYRFRHTPSPTPTATASPTPVPSPVPTASGSPTPAPSSTPTLAPTTTPPATVTPTTAPTPTPAATATATLSPTATATPAGTTYYVSPSGSDANSGTSRSLPWRTIQHAANVMAPGDLAVVMSGSYGERVTVSHSGHAGAPIAFQADAGAQPVTYGFQLGGDYLGVAGFEITNQATTEPSGYGVYITGSYDVVSNNYIHDLYMEGIMVSGNGDPSSSATAHNTISGNRIVRASMAGIHVEGQASLITGNDVSWTRQYPAGGPVRSGADADGMRFFGSGHIFRSNVIHDIPWGTTENPDPHVDCFQTWGPASDITIERNWCIWPATSESTDNEVSMIESLDGVSASITYRNNVFGNMRQGINVSQSSGLSVLNNTFENILQEAVILASSPNAAIVNNIFYDVGSGGDSYACVDSGSSAGIVIATNDHYMTSGSPGTYCSSAPYISRDPMFIDPAAMNFHLQSGSTLIDAATTLTSVIDDYDGISRPQGAGYDMGAYEFH